jgi:hypothetical protein
MPLRHTYKAHIHVQTPALYLKGLGKERMLCSETTAAACFIPSHSLLLDLTKRDISVGIGTGYGLDGKGFYLPHSNQTSLLWTGYRGLFAGRLKWPGRETDRSPKSSTEVKNGVAVPTLPHRSSCLGA